MAALAAAGGAGPSAYWYLTRGTGAVALILLTFSVALGVANVRGAQTASVPRFAFQAVHRSASLLAVVFVFIHVVTTLLDGYAPIRPIDAIVPFGAAYRPLWLGFGALAFDLLLALVLTSVLRRRLGHRAWRATHWVAYACWPLALLHGLGAGSDAKAGWMLVLSGACMIVVSAAVLARAASERSDHVGARATAVLASVLLPLGLVVWLPSGPLSAGWARKAGTPAALLTASVGRAQPAAAGATAAATATATTTFAAEVSGTVREYPLQPGVTRIELALVAAGQQLSALRIRIDGEPLAGGGVEMSGSRVTLGTPSDQVIYDGRILALRGTTITAVVRNEHGDRLEVLAELQINASSASASGTMSIRPDGHA